MCYSLYVFVIASGHDYGIQAGESDFLLGVMFVSFSKAS